MIRLEEIKPGTCIKGLVGGQPADVLAVQSYGDFLVVTCETSSGEPTKVTVFRERERGLKWAKKTRLFAFDGDGHKMRVASEALRISLAHLFDPFLAVHSSRITPLPHQLSAVYEDMLPRQSLRFLLADDPGAGKTIMAGLLIKELMIRGDLERCLIVVPGNLVEQWRDELREKFAIDFEILHPGRDASDSNCFAGHKRIIARLDMLARRDDLKRQIAEGEEWDLVVCDEAHRMSATYFGRELKRTKRYQLGELLSPRTRHFLLMTATPHNGKEDDFLLFMSLLDASRFADSPRQDHRKPEISKLPKELMRRMIKEELHDFDGKPLFPKRQAATIAYDLSEREKDLYEAVTRYVQKEMNRADAIEGGNIRRRINVSFALQILQRRLASSPAAIHESLKRRIERLQERLTQGKNWQKVDANGDEPDDDPEDELSTEEEQIVDRATAAGTIAELEAEIASLKQLENLAQTLRQSGEDTKWLELNKILDAPKVHDPERDIRRKLVIFTEARDTLNYLAERIRNRPGEEESVVVIHGGIPWNKRREAISAFNDEPKVRFLVANDAAGEGVNLQRGAHLMVNYDLPWNPNRLEQRFGRIHRIGQTETCHLWNLVAHQTREGEVYARLLEKLEKARDSLQGKVYDVLGERFQGLSLRDMLMKAIRYGEDAKVRTRLFDTIDDALDLDRIRKAVAERQLTSESINPDMLADFKQKMDRAEANRLQPHYIRSFFTEAFKLADGTIHQREPNLYEIEQVPPTLIKHRLHWKKHISACYERICFDKTHIPRDKSHMPVLAPGHPLLDATVDWVLERFGHLLQRGAVLVDETSSDDEPRILLYFQHAITDGRRDRSDRPRVISKRLQFVYLDRHGKAAAGGPAPYLDCRPLKEEETPLIESILTEDWLADSDDINTKALGYAGSKLLPQHLQEVESRRLAEIERTEKTVREHHERAIRYWEQQAIKWQEEEKQGKQPKVNAQNARRTVATIKERLERCLAEYAQEREIVSPPPKIVGAALVVPIGWFKGQADKVPSRGDPQKRVAVEQLAMNAVIESERALGRKPTDVSAENRGYDIESYDPKTETLTFIEVKGRASDAKTIAMTRNEMLTAFNKRGNYILAVVQIEGNSVIKSSYLRDPAEIFSTEPGFSEVSRNHDLGKILAKAQEPH